MFVVGGVVGSVIFGIWVENSKKYKLAFVILSVIVTLTPGILIILLPHHKIWMVDINLFFVGFGGMTLIPIGMDFSVEMTYPQPEATSSGLMMMIANVFGAIFSVTSSVLIGSLNADNGYEHHQGVKLSIIIFVFFLFISMTLSIFCMKEKLRRIEFQKEEALRQSIVQDAVDEKEA
jgi:MFS family permease